MGLYEIDNKKRYRYDVMEIENDKITRNLIDGKSPALNVGIVELRCFINGFCPFVKSQKEETNIIFNSDTYPSIYSNLNDGIKKILKCIPGTEGIFLQEKYIYRHNYLYQKTGGMFTTLLDRDGVEIYAPNTLMDTQFTRYRDEQSWLISDSVFDWYTLRNISQGKDLNYFEKKCNKMVSWEYVLTKVDSFYTLDDEALDYQTAWFKTVSKYWDENNPGIKTNYVQTPSQISSYGCDGGGVHWKVEKKTPLFQGEDFFIEFHRHAKESNVTEENQKKVKFLHPRFAPVDVLGDTYTTSPTIEVKDEDGNVVDEVVYPVNYAVLDWSAEDEEENSDAKRVTFNLYNQSYYIIEIGCNKVGGNHYFIIICERSYPIFVSIDGLEIEEQNKTKIFEVSRLLSVYNSDFNGIHGSALLKASKLRVSVRNHLGKLIITFNVDGEDISPWIIGKERIKTVNSLLNDGSGQNPLEPLIVPHDTIGIWGGNLMCGFIFGPIQYVQDIASFEWPQEFSMPWRTDIHAKLTVSDFYIADLINFTNESNVSNLNRKIFTQDAQFFKEMSILHSGSGSYTAANTRWEKGCFFSEIGPIKELSLDEKNKDSDSTIKLHALSYEEDIKRKRIKFKMGVDLGVGNHIFKIAERDDDGKRQVTSNDRYNIKNPWFKNHEDNYTLDFDKLNDEEWILNSCKTPILTQIRFVADENSDERWDVGDRENGLPDENNQYFIDASHHVMSYSESWNSAEIFSVEHTGSIQFLLKDGDGIFRKDKSGDVFENNTQRIRDLADKTFYIEVWAGYKKNIEEGDIEVEDENSDSYTGVNGLYKLFTGICSGGSIEKTYSKEIMNCQIKDFTEILNGLRFFNSPFFDGVIDANAIYEILKMAGFRHNTSFDPAHLLKVVIDDNEGEKTHYDAIDGRDFRYNYYALPSSYSRLEQPFFKSEAGGTYYEMISKIAKPAAKTFYFDQIGRAHYENYYSEIRREFNKNNNDIDNKYFIFTSLLPDQDYLSEEGSTKQEGIGQFVFNKTENSFGVESIHNHLKIMSTSPNGELFIMDDLDWASINDPNKEGFIGFLKTFYQQEGMFGSEEAVRNMVSYYRTMFNGILMTKFETYGIPLRANDYLSVDGKKMRATSVKHEISPKDNKWWMSVEGERIYFE